MPTSHPRDELYVDSLAEPVSKKTRQSYDSAVKCLVAWLKENSELDAIRTEGGKQVLFVTGLTVQVVARYVEHRRQEGVSASALSGIRSAINHCYRQLGEKMPYQMQEKFHSLLVGAKQKNEAKQKKGTSFSQKGGRDPLPFRAFRYLAGEFLKEGNTKAHLFTVLSWQLMCRCNKIAAVHLKHFQWNSDAVAITVPNRNAADAEHPKHCYANPLMPEICTNLALGLYFLCNPAVSELLFPGNDSSHTFEQAFVEMKKRNTSIVELRATGREVEQIGIHSLQTGSSTFVSASSTAGPPFVALCVRNGWRMEPDRSLHYDQAGDQFVGRAAAGLPILDADFALLPPHFDDTKLLAAGVNVEQLLIEHVYGASKTPTMIAVLKHAIASVVYHRKYLRDTLCHNHPLFATQLFTNSSLLDILGSCIVTGRKSPFMIGTGIPPHVLHRAETDEIRKFLFEVRHEVREVHDEFRKHGNGTRGGPSNDGENMHSKLNYITHLLENYVRKTEKQMDDIRTELHDIKAKLNSQTSTIASGDGFSQEIHHRHSDGNIYAVPEGYDFPRVNICLSWQQWWLGDRFAKVAPLRKLGVISPGSIRKYPAKLSKHYSEWKAVFTKVEMFLDRIGKLHKSDTMPTCVQVAEMYNAAMPFIEAASARKTKKRSHELKVSTLGPTMRKINVDDFIRDFVANTNN